MRKLVFSCDDVPKAARTKLLLGGKGLSLVEMKDLGVPVPPWFTISTSACRAAEQSDGRLPNRLAWQLKDAVGKLERGMGRQFGNPAAPLVVSVRSGAPASMPGMMDTILNLGLNAKVAAGLAKTHSPVFAANTHRRFLEMFGPTALGCDYGRVRANHPNEGADAFWITKYREVIARRVGRAVDDPFEQLALAVLAVMQSWRSERAVAYRANQGIPNWWGTAVTVQTMVFGTAPGFSGTGVVFSGDTTTGKPGMVGDWLLNAQGEDVVSGKHNARPIAELSTASPALYADLLHHVSVLEKYYDDIVDVEFTIESGKLWILQARRAKRTAAAQAITLVDRVFSKKMSKAAAAAKLTADQVAALSVASVDPVALKELSGTASVLGRGTGISGGAVHGILTTTSKGAVAARAAGNVPILVRPDTSPDDLPGMLASAGIATMVGGATSHAAVVARGLDVACVVGVTGLRRIDDGAMYHDDGRVIYPSARVTLDPASGLLFNGHLPLVEAASAWQVKHLLRWHAGGKVARWPVPKMRIVMGASRPATQMLLDFYLMEAMFRDTRVKGPLGFRQEVARARQTLAVDLAEFITGYLAAACAGELRHALEVTGRHGTRDAWRRTMKALGYDTTNAKGRNDVQNCVLAALAKQTTKEHITFFEFAEGVFGLSGWQSGYGGLKWKQIATAARMFLSGATPHVVAVDHAFDLQHNGGTVFDKRSDMIPLDKSRLKRMLDAKKMEEGGAEALLKALRQMYFSPPSPPVQALWAKGLTLKTWKAA